MAYADDVKRYLAEYKDEKFKNTSNGLWRNDPDNVLKYAFIKEEGDYNLLGPYKAKFLDYEKALKKNKKKITRHMYFHHMNSSQAMCINFFFPLFEEHKLELIIDYFGFPGEKINYDSVKFEKLSEIEPAYGHSPTNFDFYFETELGKKFYFEIKYTESEFGKTPKDKTDKTNFDEDHIKKYATVYSNHLTAISPNFQGRQQFLNNYQLMRNLIHVGQNSYVVFVYPKENTKIRTQAERSKNQIVKEEFKSNILTIEWRNIFDRVNANLQAGKLKNQFDEFGRKYFLDNPKA